MNLGGSNFNVLKTIDELMKVVASTVMLCSSLLASAQLAQISHSSQSESSRGKSATLSRSVLQGQRLLKIEEQARRLIVLGRNLRVAEDLLDQVLAADPLRQGRIHEIRAELFESQGRFEEARKAYRSAVWSDQNGFDFSKNRPSRLMRYALLSRKVGNSGEEKTTLARIPGDTLVAKMTAAWQDAHKAFNEKLEVTLLQEIRRLDSGSAWVGAALTKAQRYAAIRLEGERKRALAIENGARP